MFEKISPLYIDVDTFIINSYAVNIFSGRNRSLINTNIPIVSFDVVSN